MTIRDLEDKYQELQTQLLRGDLEEDDFRREVQKLQYVDELGRRWRIGWYTGTWFREEKGEWTRARTPPAEPAPRKADETRATAGTKEVSRRPFAFWLAGALAVVLLLVATILVAGWSLGWWTQGAEGEVAVADSPQPTSTLPATAGVEPTATASLPAATSPPSTTPSLTPTPRPTALPTATATASPAPASPSPTTAATPVPPTPNLSGRIYYPAYDATAHTFHIYVYDVAAGTREIVVRQASQPAISPDGARLAYRSWDRAQRSISVREVADGHTWEWVRFAEAGRPSWSPDSQNIAFPSQHESDRRWRIYRTRGMQLDLVRRDGGDVFGRVPAWLATGDIVYWDCPLNHCGLYRMKPDGSSPVQLTTAEHDTAPAASPDGRSVVFMSLFGNANWDLQVAATHLDAEPASRRLTTSPGRDGLPAWSPDGQWIAFVTDRDGPWAVWVMRSDGSQQEKLFELDAPLEGEIAFVSPGDQHGWLMETLAWGP